MNYCHVHLQEKAYDIKSGFVSIVGRPNVGKSTLLNHILQTKLAITSATAQTTRNTIQGIYTDDEAQIIFMDTPGIHKPSRWSRVIYEYKCT